MSISPRNIARSVKEFYYLIRFAQQVHPQQLSHTVFCFHGFHKAFGGENYGQTSQRSLSITLKALSKKYQFVSVSSLMESCISGELASNSVPKAAFTLDDGFTSQKNVLGIFRSHSIIPTVFVCPDLIDKEEVPFPELIRLALLLTRREQVPLPNHDIIRLFDYKTRIETTNAWIEAYKDCATHELSSQLSVLLSELGVTTDTIKESKYYDPPLSWENLLDLMPQIEVGSHTSNHFHLATVPAETAELEIYGSKSRIEKKLSMPCLYFAYPFGDKKSFSKREHVYLCKAGYSAAFSLEPGYIGQPAVLFALSRFNASSGLGTIFQYSKTPT